MTAEAPIDPALAEHYTWGAEENPCDGWHLVRTPELSVILERMPAGACEVRHYHERARQFFFVLEGCLTIELDGREFALDAGSGLEVAPGKPHQAFNRATRDLRMLVISQPPSHGDRVTAAAHER
ncbi:MAG TPA: cupin domain-containing protein [Terriglobia bacterium]|nr:cupin domain-containing protein [Terriglobia bacterium]